MRLSIFSASLLAVLMFANSASAALLGLQNTGPSGWSFGTKPAGSGSLTVVTTNNPSWGIMAGSSWLSDVSNAAALSSPSGAYQFQTSFDLTGASVFNLNLSFNMLYDDSISVDIINGLGTTNLYSSLAANFALPAASVVVNPALVTNTVNTLRFTVTNAAVGGTNPVGLNVVFTNQSYDGQPPPIPEPISAALWAGFIGMGLVARRRFKK